MLHNKIDLLTHMDSTSPKSVHFPFGLKSKQTNPFLSNTSFPVHEKKEAVPAIKIQPMSHGWQLCFSDSVPFTESLFAPALLSVKKMSVPEILIQQKLCSCLTLRTVQLLAEMLIHALGKTQMMMTSPYWLLLFGAILQLVKSLECCFFLVH